MSVIKQIETAEYPDLLETINVNFKRGSMENARSDKGKNFPGCCLYL